MARLGGNLHRKGKGLLKRDSNLGLDRHGVEKAIVACSKLANDIVCVGCERRDVGGVRCRVATASAR